MFNAHSNHPPVKACCEIVHRVDHELRRIVTTWRGSFDLEAVAENCRRSIAEGAHAYPQLIDATAAEIARDPTDSRTLGVAMGRLVHDSQAHGPAGPVAIVVGSQVDFGMCRAVATYFEPAGEIRVVYHLQEALDWLGWKA
jgi:hypothetical protein